MYALKWRGPAIALYVHRLFLGKKVCSPLQPLLSASHCFSACLLEPEAERRSWSAGRSPAVATTTTRQLSPRPLVLALESLALPLLWFALPFRTVFRLAHEDLLSHSPLLCPMLQCSLAPTFVCGSSGTSSGGSGWCRVGPSAPNWWRCERLALGAPQRPSAPAALLGPPGSTIFQCAREPGVGPHSKPRHCRAVHPSAASRTSDSFGSSVACLQADNNDSSRLVNLARLALSSGIVRQPSKSSCCPDQQHRQRSQ